jgi:hypothetical protein
MLTDSVRKQRSSWTILTSAVRRNRFTGGMTTVALETPVARKTDKAFWKGRVYHIPDMDAVIVK